MPIKVLDEITNPFLNFKVQRLKFRNEQTISFHTL